MGIGGGDAGGDVLGARQRRNLVDRALLDRGDVMLLAVLGITDAAG